MEITDHAEIEELISKLVHERFAKAEVVSVNIKKDFDHDGDEILLVEVVFSNPNHKSLVELALGFLSHLRTNLVDNGINAFPVMSYVSEQEAEAATA